jgi:hypothetical protein
MKHMMPRKLILYVLLSAVVCGGLVLGAGFAALHSPWFLSRLASVFGYKVQAQSISLSPNLSGSISGLRIESAHEGGLKLVAAKVTVKNALDMVLRGQVDSLELHDPRFTFQVGKGGGGDLSSLKGLPNIRFLSIQNAEVLLTFEGSQQQVRLTGANLSVKDFSSRAGGRISLQSRAEFTSGAGNALAGQGTITGDFQLAGVDPRPYGTGTVQCMIDSGQYTSDGRTLALGGLALTADLLYDRKDETFAITALRGQGRSLGSVSGTARAVLRGEMPWSANLSVTAIDFAQVFTLVKPFLPEENRAWTVQGRGAVETELRGTYMNDQPAFGGTVTFSFSDGGFSSPEGTKAGQGLRGRMVLKLQYAASDRKIAFQLHSEERDGEYLWGTYYNSLAGQEVSLAVEGALFEGSGGHFELNGSLDIFQTGQYAFSADGTTSDWTIQLTAADVSHPRILRTLLDAYLKESAPRLAGLSLTGASMLETTIRHAEGATSIRGTYRTVGVTANAPGLPLAIQGLDVSLPFDLRYPAADERAPSAPRPGFIRAQHIQARRLSVDNLEIPLRVEENRLEMPEPVTIPFFGGTIHLYGVQVDDLLAPRRYRFGVKVVDVDLGRLSRRLTGTEYPGTINADLGLMQYEKSRLASEGRAVIDVFGGEIEATNFFAENLGSPSSRYGGDITFRKINLGELTRKIAIGRMSGVIQGSLTDLVIEYGQPASFSLEIESVETPGVAQWVSLDAIQNISILGTGAGSAMNQWITAFFKEYPYRKIGIRCVLHNDEFTVRGTIHELGKEYLVRRGFLRGVDVVNQNPENDISFKDMQERIERIFRRSEAGTGGIEQKTEPKAEGQS